MTRLPGLNALRLYAALCVLIIHAVPREELGLLSILPGSVAVTLFFALSGYLITYRLLLEKQQYGRIDVWAFLQRRTLRIWPLYYVVLVAGYMLPLGVQTWTLPGMVLFGGALLHALDPSPVHWIGTLWSISVEELFYLVWPFLLARYPLLRVIAVILAVRLVIDVLAGYQQGTHVWWVLAFFRLECMAIGALVAYAAHTRGALYRAFRHPLVVGLSLVTCAALMTGLVVDSWTWLGWVTQSLVFGVVILWLSTRPATLLDAGWVNYWAERSYGIYMIHFPVIGLLHLVVSPHEYAFVLIVTTVVTLLLADLSYRYLETPFLRRKRYSTANPVQ